MTTLTKRNLNTTDDSYLGSKSVGGTRVATTGEVPLHVDVAGTGTKTWDAALCNDVLVVVTSSTLTLADSTTTPTDGQACTWRIKPGAYTFVAPGSWAWVGGIAPVAYGTGPLGIDVVSGVYMAGSTNKWLCSFAAF